MDLDNCLIYSHKWKDDCYNYTFDIDGVDYFVLERNHVDEFLDFCFDNFEVTIFTASTKDYADLICENLLKKYKGKFRLLTRKDCNTIVNPDMYSMTPNVHLKNVYDYEIIVDDIPDNVVLIGKNSHCIPVSVFSYAPWKDDIVDFVDDELLGVIEKLKKFI